MTEIDTCRAQNEWLGKQEGSGEYPRSRNGAFARYEHGDIYTHPEFGTWAIPDEFRSVWAEHNYETGWLGYPIGKAFSGVQPFEHGWIVGSRFGETAFATWIDPNRYGWPVEKALGLDTGHIIQRTTEGKFVRFPDGEIVRYELNELTPPELEYRSRPTWFLKTVGPDLPEDWEPEPEFPNGLDYDPDDLEGI